MRSLVVSSNSFKTKGRKLVPLCAKQFHIAVVSISVSSFSLGLRWASHDWTRGKGQESTKINDLLPLSKTVCIHAKTTQPPFPASPRSGFCGHLEEKQYYFKNILMLSSSKLSILPGSSSLVAQQSAFDPDVVDRRMQQRPTVFCAFCFVSQQRGFFFLRWKVRQIIKKKKDKLDVCILKIDC